LRKFLNILILSTFPIVGILSMVAACAKWQTPAHVTLPLGGALTGGLLWLAMRITIIKNLRMYGILGGMALGALAYASIVIVGEVTHRYIPAFWCTPVGILVISSVIRFCYWITPLREFAQKTLGVVTESAPQVSEQ